MKAARLLGPKHFELVDAEVPTPKEGQCLIKVERVSICGSDIRREYGPLFPEEHYPLRLGAPCHECAGVVVESRCKEFREGQRVIVLPTQEGSGGLVEYIASSPGRMIGVPDDGDLAQWLMCQPSGTVLYSCQRAGSVLGKDVAIAGQGGIGLSFSMILSRLGARRVIAIDMLDYRLEWAKSMGATHTINPGREDVVKAVQELTDGRGADVAVEAAGYPDTLDMCFRVVRQFGTVVVFGIQSDTMVPVEHNLWMDKQCTIIPTTGARSGDPTTHINLMVGLRSRGWGDPGQMVTHRLAFKDVQKAYDMYEGQKDNVLKVVMSL